MLDRKVLRENRWNRIGDLVINNKNYKYFEKWFNSMMDELILGQTSQNF